MKIVPLGRMAFHHGHRLMPYVALLDSRGRKCVTNRKNCPFIPRHLNENCGSAEKRFGFDLRQSLNRLKWLEV
jgi:hypothetical protein